MSLSLEKVQQRQRKKVVTKSVGTKESVPKKTSPSARQNPRPWQAHQAVPEVTKKKQSEPPPRSGRLKTWLHKPKTFTFMGVSLEIGSRTRLHLPPLHRKRP